MTTKIPVELSSTPSIVDNGDATAITITSDEKVGIGTTSPTSALQVVGDASVGSGFTQIRSGHPSFSITNGNTDTVYFSIAPHGGSYSTFMEVVDDDTDVDSIKLKTSGTERMRINSSGQVMVGTSDAGYPDYGDSLTLSDVDGGSGNAGMTIRSGTSSYGTLYFSDDTGTALGTYAGKLQYYHSDNSMALNTSSYERMRIDSSGNLLINTTTRKNTGSRVSIKPVGSGVAFETQPSDSNGYYVALFYNNSSSLVGSIYTSPSSTSFNTSSDYRLKENVSYEFDALSRVTQLKPARFNFIADADITVDGFLAHEVSDIVPEAVTGEKDGEEMQGIDQSKLVPLLTKAIQEQQAIIEDLKTQINEVKNGN